MPRDSEVYRRAAERVRAIWSGAPCDITNAQKTELYAPLRGFAPYLPSTRIRSPHSPHPAPRSSGRNGDPILGHNEPKPALLG